MDIGILVPILAMCIPLVAVARRPIQSWIDMKERTLRAATDETAERAAQYAAKTERLEQRVAVLERIITDRSAHLADEIERLRDRPLN